MKFKDAEKFKVGDKVKILESDYKQLSVGDIRIVESITDYYVRLWVNGGDSNSMTLGFLPHKIEHVKIKATKLAKKMYPNRREEKGWLV